MLLPSKSIPTSGKSSKRKHSKRKIATKSSRATLSATTSVTSLSSAAQAAAGNINDNSLTQIAGAAVSNCYILFY